MIMTVSFLLLSCQVFPQRSKIRETQCPFLFSFILHPRLIIAEFFSPYSLTHDFIFRLGGSQCRINASFQTWKANKSNNNKSKKLNGKSFDCRINVKSVRHQLFIHILVRFRVHHVKCFSNAMPRRKK